MHCERMLSQMLEGSTALKKNCGCFRQRAWRFSSNSLVRDGFDLPFGKGREALDFPGFARKTPFGGECWVGGWSWEIWRASQWKASFSEPRTCGNSESCHARTEAHDLYRGLCACVPDWQTIAARCSLYRNKGLRGQITKVVRFSNCKSFAIVPRSGCGPKHVVTNGLLL